MQQSHKIVGYVHEHGYTQKATDRRSDSQSASSGRKTGQSQRWQRARLQLAVGAGLPNGRPLDASYIIYTTLIISPLHHFPHHIRPPVGRQLHVSCTSIHVMRFSSRTCKFDARENWPAFTYQMHGPAGTQQNWRELRRHM